MAQKVRSAAEILDLTHLLDRLPKQLSGGQRQRVAMGRAIVRDPEVFLFDEPLSNLDAKLRVQMRTEIKSLHQRLKTTIVYVTHDQVEAMTMADRIVVMNKGQVEQVGAPLELYDRPNNLFVAAFIGSPSMNLIDGTVAAAGDGFVFTTVNGASFPVPAATGKQAVGREVVAGIRPEHVELAGPSTNAAMQAVAAVLEPTGSETMVALHLNGHEVVALTKERIDVAPGSTLHIRFPQEKIHLFDRETGARLS